MPVKLEDELLSDIGGAAAGPSGNSYAIDFCQLARGSGGGDPDYGAQGCNMIAATNVIDQNMKGKACVVKIRLAPDGGWFECDRWQW